MRQQAGGGCRTSPFPGPESVDAMATETRRTPARRASKLAVSLAALVMSLSAVAPAAATQTGAGVARHEAAPRTTVTLRIPRCPGCVVAVFNLVGATNYRPPLRMVPIRGGVGRFTVRTAATRGMSFGMTGTGPYTAVAVRPDIAVAVAGVPIGAPVTVAQASRTLAAARCWTGTTRARFTIHVRLVTFRTLTMDGSRRVTSVAFWASPNLPGFGLQHLSHSRGYPNVAAIGDQDAPYCEGFG
jgi:hypothetical protein